MKGRPRIGPNPMDPINRAIIAEAKVGALSNAIFALSAQMRVVIGNDDAVRDVLDGIVANARSWDPFPVGYEPSGGEKGVPHPAQDWTPHVAPDQRVALNRLTREAVADEVKAIRDFLPNLPDGD